MEAEKKRCPTCGHIIDQREIALYRGLILALFRVWTYLLGENRGYRFTRKDIKHLLHSESETARFGDLVMFGGLVFKEGKACYGLNMERCELFFTGKYALPIRVWKDPITGQITPEDYRFIHEIPKLKDMFDKEGLYLARYKERQLKMEM